MRLDLALIRLYPQLSRRKAQGVIEKGQVSVDGVTAREPGRAVEAANRIAWDPNRRALPRARLDLPLLYQDDSLLVVDKPAGMLAVPTATGRGEEDSVLGRVKAYVQRLTPRRPFVAPVHRLDRDTTGALALALSHAARTSLRRLFREHRIERRYLALVQGSPRTKQGVVDRPIHAAYRDGRRRVARPGEPALDALTRWRLIERLGKAALLEVTLETGRQHQIRLHLAQVGLPVIGDETYRLPGSPRSGVRARRQMLHARLLGFEHPLTGERVRVESPLPADLKRVLAALRRQAGGQRT